MAMGQDRELAGTVTDEPGESNEYAPVTPVDCSAIAQMPLPALLYRVLVGDEPK